MKPDKQRIAIAEACGWKDVRGVTHLGIPPEGGRLFPYPEYHQEDWRLKPFHGIPDYLNDLNAMHEAEKTIENNPSLVLKYYQTLSDMIDRKPDGSQRFGACLYWESLHASAKMRAEAFLRTIGKWEE